LEIGLLLRTNLVFATWHIFCWPRGSTEAEVAAIDKVGLAIINVVEARLA
jgi:hypothetical protein